MREAFETARMYTRVAAAPPDRPPPPPPPPPSWLRLTAGGRRTTAFSATRRACSASRRSSWADRRVGQLKRRRSVRRDAHWSSSTKTPKPLFGVRVFVGRREMIGRYRSSAASDVYKRQHTHTHTHTPRLVAFVVLQHQAELFFCAWRGARRGVHGDPRRDRTTRRAHGVYKAETCDQINERRPTQHSRATLWLRGARTATSESTPCTTRPTASKRTNQRSACGRRGTAVWRATAGEHAPRERVCARRLGTLRARTVDLFDFAWQRDATQIGRQRRPTHGGRRRHARATRAPTRR